jgi:hypothetical protein
VATAFPVAGHYCAVFGSRSRAQDGSRQFWRYFSSGDLNHLSVLSSSGNRERCGTGKRRMGVLLHKQEKALLVREFVRIR